MASDPLPSVAMALQNKSFQVASTLVIAAIGAGFAFASGAPAPFLVGPALLVALSALLGLPVQIPVWLRNLCFIIIGLTMGAGVTPEVIETARQWPFSFVILAIALLLIILIGKWLLVRKWHYDPMTALMSVVPGHLSYVLGLSAETKGDLATIGVVQSIRLLALTILVPFAVVFIGIDAGVPVGPVVVMPFFAFALSMAISLAVGFVLERFKLPAAYLIAGLLWSTGSHITGTIDGTVAPNIGTPAFIIMGALIGTRFTGVTIAMLKRAFVAGTSVTLVAFGISAFAAWLVSLFVDVPMSQLLIAFAPGGVETMAAMAVSMNADPAFVAAHHVMRLLILTFLAPIMLSLTRSSSDVSKSKTGN